MKKMPCPECSEFAKPAKRCGNDDCRWGTCKSCCAVIDLDSGNHFMKPSA